MRRKLIAAITAIALGMAMTTTGAMAFGGGHGGGGGVAAAATAASAAVDISVAAPLILVAASAAMEWRWAAEVSAGLEKEPVILTGASPAAALATSVTALPVATSTITRAASVVLAAPTAAWG